MPPPILSYDFHEHVKSAQTVAESRPVVNLVTANWDYIYNVVAWHTRALKELMVLDAKFRSDHMLLSDSSTFEKAQAPQNLVYANDAYDHSSSIVGELHRVFALAGRKDLSKLLDKVLSTVPYEFHVHVQLI